METGGGDGGRERAPEGGAGEGVEQNRVAQPRQVPPNLRRRTGPDRFGPGRVWSGPVRVWAGFGSVRASLIGPVRAGPVRLSVVP